MPGDRNLTVYRPRGLSTVLQMLRRDPNTPVVAGATYLTRERLVGAAPGNKLISIHAVEEISKITRSERFIEFGAAVTIREILSLGDKVVDSPLVAALQNIGSPAVQSLATIGGNLCAPDRTLTLAPVLQLLEAQAEIRRQGNSRWIPVPRLRGKGGSLTLEEGEIVTRVRVPLGNWDRTLFWQSGSPGNNDLNYHAVTAVARTEKRVVEEIRFVLAFGRSSVIRDRELEAEYVGRRLPLTSKEQTGLRRGIEELLYSGVETPLPLQRFRAIRLVQRFMGYLGAADPTEKS